MSKGRREEIVRIAGNLHRASGGDPDALLTGLINGTIGPEGRATMSKKPAKPGKPGKNGQPTRKQILPVELTVEEKLARGSEWAALEAERAAVEIEKGVVVATFKDRLAGIDYRIGLIGKAIREGTEPREVDVQDEPDYRGGEMRTVRLDTGEVVAQRALTVDERQTEIPGA